ncbi:hypothetical protein OEA41_008557 [Lepraria neglecta]|uniref:BTB domain-containing protein n=1 Tax=Lepraria neglecta TaxID=209136 RepID=A0AAD9ZET9_9LECA|nr:hypothetical protein OEA41_008557 [Lepraria neglecta]
MAQTSPILHLLVGPTRTTFHVHLKPICDASPFFERTLRGGKCRDAPSASVELCEDEVETVDRFVSWIYSGRFALSTFSTEENTHKRFHELAKLNMFANKYTITALANDIIDRLWDPWDLYFKNLLSSRSIFCPRVSLVRHVYETTSPKSAFRRLLVDWYTWEIPLKWFDDERTREELGDVSQDFAVDLAVALARRMADPDRQSPFALQKKEYYGDLEEESEDDEAVDLRSCRGD